MFLYVLILFVDDSAVSEPNVRTVHHFSTLQLTIYIIADYHLEIHKMNIKLFWALTQRCIISLCTCEYPQIMFGILEKKLYNDQYRTYLFLL